MGKKNIKHQDASATPEPPQLARRRQNRTSSFKMGRTIGEKRERLETANERAAARKKDKKRKAARIISTTLGFVFLVAILCLVFFMLVGNGDPKLVETSLETVTLKPTVEIIDEEAAAGGHISSRMESYIAQAEQDFKDSGFTPIKVVIPSGGIREVDFYLEGRPGFIKMTIDRDSAISVEDVSRLYHYLESIGVSDFSYIDVRIDRKAYWK